MIPGNPHAQPALDTAMTEDGAALTLAVLALAFEQHQRNRLAAITASQRRDITLPPDLEALATEGTKS